MTATVISYDLFRVLRNLEQDIARECRVAVLMDRLRQQIEEFAGRHGK